MSQAQHRRTGWSKSAVVIILALIAGMVAIGPASAATVLCNSSGWQCDSSGYGPNSGNSYWGQYTGHNCTNYVAYRMIANGSPLRLPGVPGNAKNWANYLSANYGIPVDANPAVGAIAHWNANEGGYSTSEGHVAYVTEVGAGYIVVEEDNWQSTNRRVRFNAGEAAYPKRFIHVKDVGPAGGSPFGFLDQASSPAPGMLRVAGWTADPDSPTASIDVHVYANSTGFNLGAANTPRDDVARVYPGYGSSHGFSRDLTLAAGGSYKVCAFGINIGGGSNQPLRDCKQVQVADPQPWGYLDSVSVATPGAVTVTGWAADPSDPKAALDVHVYADQQFLGAVRASQTRSDVGQALGAAYGPNHGYQNSVAAPAGSHRICTYAINVGVGDNQQLKECKTVTVAPAPPAPATPVAPAPVAPPVAVTPAAPTGVLAAPKFRCPRRGVAFVSWIGVENASSYRFRASWPNSTKKWTKWTQTSNTWMRLSRLRKGSKYHFQIQPVGAGGAGPVKGWTFVQKR